MKKPSKTGHIDSLVQISETLHRQLKVDQLLESLTIEAMKLTNSRLGWAGVPTEGGMSLVRHVSKGYKVLSFEYTWPPGIGWPGWVLAHKVPYVTNDALSDEVIVPEIRKRFKVRSGIDTPILNTEGNVLGFFEVNNKNSGTQYTAQDVEKLMAVSRIASVALRNAFAYEKHQLAGVALEQLTFRQREILRRIAEGLNTKEIAALLNISTKTVEAHRLQIMRRIKIDNVPGLVRFAIRSGLASADA